MPSFTICAPVWLSALGSQKRTHRLPIEKSIGGSCGHLRFLTSSATVLMSISTTSGMNERTDALKMAASHTASSSARMRAPALKSCHSRPMSITCVTDSEDGS